MTPTFPLADQIADERRRARKRARLNGIAEGGIAQDVELGPIEQAAIAEAAPEPEPQEGDQEQEQKAGDEEPQDEQAADPFEAHVSSELPDVLEEQAAEPETKPRSRAKRTVS